MEGRRAWIESWPANEDFLIDACGFHEHMAYTKMGNGPEVEKAIATLFAPKKPLSSGKIVVSGLQSPYIPRAFTHEIQRHQSLTWTRISQITKASSLLVSKRWVVDYLD